MTMGQLSDLAVRLNIILDDIGKNPNLRLLMRKFSEPSSFLDKLLLASPDVLFVEEELIEPAPNGTTAIRLPVLFWTSLSLSENAESSLKHLLNFVQLRREGIETLKLRWQEIASQAMNEQVVRDLLAYFAIKFARNTPETKALVSRKKLSYRNMKRSLGNYENVNVDQVFSEVLAVSKGKPDHEIDDDVVRILNNMPRQLYTAMLSDISRTLLEGAPYPDIMLDELAGQSLRYVEDIEYTIQMTPQHYRESLNELFDLKLLEVLDAIFWCGNREHEPMVLRSKANLSALDLGPNCPKCHQPMDYSVAYQLVPSLKDAVLFAGGGMLSILVGWILKQKSIKHVPSADLDGNEIDFLLDLAKGKWLVECKMHRPDIEPRAFIQACQKDIRKVEKKIEIIKAKGMELDSRVLVYNWSHHVIENIMEKAGSFVSRVKNAGIDLIGYDAFENTLIS